MPPVQSVPSDEVDDDVAFKILNQDNLPIAVVGQGLLGKFDRVDVKQKPNVIVYPTRRIPNNSLEENKQKQFSKSHGFINTNEDIYDLKKTVSNSHGNIANNFDEKFTKTLDSKLRKLQKEEKQLKKNPVDLPKKPFVTTVKKGQFLEPPPEIASLLGFKNDDKEQKREEKKLYAYASRPRVLNKLGHRSRCEAAARAAGYVISAIAGFQPKEFSQDAFKKLSDGPLPYGNIMFDRRVHRGSNYAQCPPLTGEGESAAARAVEARRRAQARRKAQKQQVRGMELRLGSPPAVKGRVHERVQTDQYLEEIWLNPETTDMCTQTDLFLERPISPFFVPACTGADVATQIYPGDLFDFDMEVQPILEVLVGKTIEQALIEVLEEEELAALREQQRRFLELRAAETAEAQRIVERERRLQAEKERSIAACERGLELQREMEERIAASVLMQGYMADLLPSVLEGLENEGFLTDSIKQDLDDSFMPWLMREVTHEMQEMVSSRDILTEMVKEILETRAEIYKALNRTPREPASEEEEEQPTFMDPNDLDLTEHMKLKEEIAIAQGAERPKL